MWSISRSRQVPTYSRAGFVCTIERLMNGQSGRQPSIPSTADAETKTTSSKFNHGAVLGSENGRIEGGADLFLCGCALLRNQTNQKVAICGLQNCAAGWKRQQHVIIT